MFRDGAQVELGSRNERPMTRYFLKVVEAVRGQPAAPSVVDAEIFVPDATGQRLDLTPCCASTPAASRIRLLAEQTPARMI